MLGRYLEVYLDQLGPEALAWLLPDHKAVLLSVSRRRGTLDDSVLAALCDPAFACLDLSGAGRALSDDAVCAAVCSMPGLQALDITGCCVSARTLQRVAAACPRLQLLRLGGSAEVEAAVLAALPDLLPRVSRVAEELLTDSWEDLEQPGGDDAEARCTGSPVDSDGAPPGAAGPGPGSKSAAAAAAFGRGRMSELRWVIWPAGAAAPRAAAAAAGAGGDALGDKLLSIAERFRQAYIDQERRLRERDKRAAEVLRRRQLKGSPALRAYEAFFDDGPAAI
ncbi:hypothetical protein FOA52_012219 [Chlamydomonas sp. UWO 241]|nr:hypothetical protein FOA52_012219 [Chlamydomonas sp. UWO 241]